MSAGHAADAAAEVAPGARFGPEDDQQPGGGVAGCRRVLLLFNIYNIQLYISGSRLKGRHKAYVTEGVVSESFS